MPVRNFSGGKIEAAAGGCAVIDNIAGDVTFAGIVRVPQAGSEYFLSATPSAGSYYGFGKEPELGMYRSTGGSFMSTLFDGGDWTFVAVAKASGTAKAKLYRYNFETEVWTIQEPLNNVQNPAGAWSTLVFGQWGGSEQVTGDMAALALWNKKMSEAEIKALAEATFINDWLTTEPVGMWTFHQTSVEEEVLDLTGNGADELSHEGTTVVEEEPPIPYGEGEEPEPAAPDATTEPATLVTSTTARLNGKVKANGKATDYYFEYGEGEAFDKVIPISEDGDGGEAFANKAVLQNLTGLKPNTLHKFRLVAKNELGEDTGAVQEFTTEAEGEEPPPESSVKVSIGGNLVDAARYVRVGGELVPA